MSNIMQIKQFGQKIWLDNLSRELLQSGQLTQLINEDGIAGVTSNPSIFYKAISTDKLYANDLKHVKQSVMSLESRYEELVTADIKHACDIMLPIYNTSNKEDGYVSLELSPHLAHDIDGTIDNARRLWKTINKPNLMIKVPATKAGIKALETIIADGINVNITLLFSLQQVENTWQAYIVGLTMRLNKSLPISHIKSVASFFLSRIDSAVDAKLPEALQGLTAINLSKTAYLRYQEIFHGDQFAKLKMAGAKGQYLLWASTGTKNPKYTDVLYVEELIGNETINTVPDATLSAFRDHGVAKLRLNDNINNAPNILNDITNAGINLTEVGEQLQHDGLKLFEDSFNQLLGLVK